MNLVILGGVQSVRNLAGRAEQTRAHKCREEQRQALRREVLLERAL